MKIAFALMMIIFLAFSGYHLTFRRFKLPFMARTFYMTGSEFLFLGLLLGPGFIDLLDDKTQSSLFFLHALLLGWIGLIFGFQFEWTKLKRFPSSHVLAAIVEGTLSFFLIFLGMHLTVRLFPGLARIMSAGDIIALSAIGGCTAQTGLALVASEDGPRSGELLHFLQAISSIGGMIPLVVFGLFFSLGGWPHPASPWLNNMSTGLAVLLMASLGFLLILVLFLREVRQDNELILFLMAVTILGSGLSSALGIPSLFFMFIMGLLLVNSSREKERVYRILITIEKPVYLLVLVLLGASWEYISSWVVLLALLFCLYRGLVKVLTGGVVRSFPNVEGERFPVLSGLGLLHQGGLSLALLLEFQHGYALGTSSWLASLILIGVILNEVLGAFSLGWFLRKNDP